MKRLISLIALIPLFLSLFSCSEDKDFQKVDTPTFKVVSFEKVLVSGVYNCKANNPYYDYEIIEYNNN